MTTEGYRQTYRRKCTECPDWFDAIRPDTHLCSNRCRVRASRKRRHREVIDMTTFRERVEAAVLAELEAREVGGMMTADVARTVTDKAIAAMQGARPCVTCGKGIGPAKVAKGYVQCYNCTRTRPL